MKTIENKILVAGEPCEHKEAIQKEGFYVDEKGSFSGWMCKEVADAIRNKEYIAIVASEDVNCGACGGAYGSIRHAREISKDMSIYFMSTRLADKYAGNKDYGYFCSGAEIAGATKVFHMSEYKKLIAALKSLKK